MNRGIALFVALAVLVAHSLAIHVDAEGGLAAPYDRASAAFRLARNLVHEGQLAWLPGTSGLDAYPSPLWVAICVLAERLNLGTNLFAQTTGMLFGLATVVVASRFHPDRTASLIAPLLLAVSGGLAAACISGLETTLAAFLLAAAFLAFERGRSATFGLSLAALGLARPEGWILALVFLALRLLPAGRAGAGSVAPRAAGAPAARPGRIGLAAFALPLGAFVLLGLARQARTGGLLGPYLSMLPVLEEGDLAAGVASLWDFARVAASPVLVLYSVWYLFRGRFSATGMRALVLAATWIALVTLKGGGHQPFHESLVPALPVLLIAAQEGMISALNSTRRPVRGLAWGTFLGAVLLSAFASRSPADVGPLPLAELQRRWLEPSDARRRGIPGMPPALARDALEQEIRVTRHLRSVGIFLRDHLSLDATVATPWPGAIGYLSRLPVHDLLGRVTPPGPGAPRRPWIAAHRVDLLSSLAHRPHYLVATLESGLRAPTPAGLAGDLLVTMDSHTPTEARFTELRDLLAEYELVTVPIGSVEHTPIPFDEERAYLLRRRDLDLGPSIGLAHEEGSFAVTMRHQGHLQLAELRVVGRDAGGETWHLSPTGEFVREPAFARTHLLVHPTGEREVELIRAPLPRGRPRLVELEALLLNPGTPSRPHAFAAVSNEATLDLR